MKLPPQILLTSAGFTAGVFVCAWWNAENSPSQPSTHTPVPAVKALHEKGAKITGLQPLAKPDVRATTEEGKFKFESDLQIKDVQTSLTTHAAKKAPVIPAFAAPLPAVADPSTIEERAQLVQQEANQELERLIPLLNLSEDQQDQVFTRLAQNSVHWTPGLSAVSNGSEPVGSGTTPISNQTKSVPDLLMADPPVLTDDQVEDLAKADAANREWWENMLGQIRENMTTGTSSASSVGTPASVEPSPVVEVGADTVVD